MRLCLRANNQAMRTASVRVLNVVMTVCVVTHVRGWCWAGSAENAALTVQVSDAAPSPAANLAVPATVFLEAARTVTASIQMQFYDEKTGLYAQTLQKRDPEFMWGNGVMFSALVAASRHEPKMYRPVMERFFTAMERYWDAKAKVPGYEPSPTAGNGHDKYYDDNQWMVITFMEAYELTGDVKYLDRAAATLAFSLSGWDDELGGGIWWHEGKKGGAKNTCANAPAAVAALRVARHQGRDKNVQWAHKLVRWTSEQLQDKDGLFFDNKRAADGGVDERKYTYNTALMLRANLGLYRVMIAAAPAAPETAGEARPEGKGGDSEQAVAQNNPIKPQKSAAEYLAETKRIGAACGAFVKKETGAYRDGMKFTHLLVEADLELYRATGDAAVLARARRNGEVAWARWKSSPSKELIEQAATARMLWLLADAETEVGRAFWMKMDGESQSEKNKD